MLATAGSIHPPWRAGAASAPRGAGSRLGRWCVLLALLLPAATARALAPHELLLLVNQNSPRSLEIANRYVQLRRLPPENVVYLALPDSVREPPAECSPDEFTRWIWEPAGQILRERGLESRMLAWAYSADFPVRITSTPPLSLTGLTFTRNQLPPAGLTDTGRYASAFFAGPNQSGGPQADSHSFRWFHDTTHGALPLPAMLLAHTGARGLEVPEVLQGLDQASAPLPRDWTNGAVWFVATDDVRSKMRDWQFPQARAELAEAGVTAVITNALPVADAPAVLGLMSGAAWITPPARAYLPGCYADHCTSFGALLHTADQTKLSAWLRAGATLSAGTVTEPFSLWTKFPGARFFAHYAHGCSALESLAQSVRCPLQLLPVGDPLAAPWAKSFRVWLEQQQADGRVSFRLHCDSEEALALNIQFFLDGRPLGEASRSDATVIQTAPLADGYHRVRAVASTGFLVIHTAAAEDGFLLDRRGRAVALGGVPADGRVDLWHPLRLSVTAAGAPREVGWYSGERLLARGRSREFTLDPAVLGAGVVALQAAAFHADGAVIRSAPARLEIRRANRPPVIRALPRTAARKQMVEVRPDVFDPDGDPVTLMWCQPLPLTATGTPTGVEGVVRNTPAGVAFSTTNAAAVWLFPRRQRGTLTEVAVTLLPTADSLTARARAGLVFNVHGGESSFFGLVGETSGWTLGACRAGTLTPVAARGAPVRPGAAYRLSVRAGARGGLECRVNDELVLRREKMTLAGEGVGLLVSGPGAVFTNLLVSPPDLPPNAWQFDGARLLLLPAAMPEAGLLLQADDGHATATQAWPAGP
ncbi:MAG: hypothetical protein NTV49_09415 [Kiritimatiellaeota bacterium]|nr:hypothetical protein [Kiritimatiellota bacterium]